MKLLSAFIKDVGLLIQLLMNRKFSTAFYIIRYLGGPGKNTRFAEAATAKGDWEEAVRKWLAVFRTSVDKVPVRVWVMLARSYRNTNRLIEARDIARKGLIDYPNNPALHGELAEIAMVREDWEEAVSQWGEVVDNMNDDIPKAVWLRLYRSCYRIDDIKKAKRFILKAIEHDDEDVKIETAKISVALAEETMSKKDWEEAISVWGKVIDSTADYRRVHQVGFSISAYKGLSNLSDYTRTIEKYQEAKAKKPPKIAVFTAISGNYDSLKLPEYLDERFDYIVFTDRPIEDSGIYDIRPMPYIDSDKTRSARYVKTHPHTLLKGYDLAIWIDANIMILSDISSIIEDFVKSNKPLAAIPHPQRENIFEELAACIERGKDEKEIMERQVEYYRKQDTGKQFLIESNFMIFDLKSKVVEPFCDFWWAQIDKFSKRDQLSLPFAIEQQGIDWHPITKKPNSIRDHESFVLIPHNFKSRVYRKLLKKVAPRVIDPFDNESFFNQRGKILAQEAKSKRSYEVIVCVHNALVDVKDCLNSIKNTKPTNNFRLIIVDDGSEKETALYLQRFAQDNNSWVKLVRNHKTERYTKAANKGLRESVADFVILLNSDTVTTGNWVEKMAHAVFSTPGAGIVGPLSSAASHQSIPEHLSTKEQTAINELPPGITPDNMNTYCERWSLVNIYPLVPLVHGFCLGLTRKTIDRVGYFDEKNFPNGYGEENDYCFRATDAGIGLVVATNTYIYHTKSKSYIGKKRIKLMKRGNETLAKLWGKERIRRAILSIQDNPNLQRQRRKATEIYNKIYNQQREEREHLIEVLKKFYNYTPVNQQGERRVDLVLQGGDTKPTSSAFIRLISPLTSPEAKERVSLYMFDGAHYESSKETDVCIVQRTAIPTTEKAEKLIESLKINNTKLIIDVDDAFSDIDESHPEYHTQKSKVNALQTLAKNAEALTASTKIVADAFNHPNTRVIQNCLDFRIWQKNISQKIPGHKSLQLLYMGTVTHQNDLKLILPALDELAENYPGSFHLTIIGIGTENLERPWITDLTKHIPSNLHPEFVQWLQRQGPFDIGLAPLVSNKFNKAKSDIKVLDYIAINTVPLVSDLPPYKNEDIKPFVISVGGSSNDWKIKLQKYIKDPTTIKTEWGIIYPNAQAYVQSERDIRKASNELLKLILS